MLMLLRCISLVLAPLLLGSATFWWTDGRYGVTGGTLVALAAISWVYGLLHVWEQFADRLPRLAGTGVILTLLGSFGGIAFGLQGFYEGLFGVSGSESLEAAARHPIAANIVLWIPGPLMPTAFVLLGITLAAVRVVPRWQSAAWVVGGIAFPLSRVSRAELLAHLADMALLVAFVALAATVARDELTTDKATTDTS